MKKIHFIGLTALTFSACSITTLSVNDIQNKEFNITHFESNNKTFILPKNAQANISFDDKDKRVFGISACNRFFGTYTDEENTIKIDSNLASTKMLCDNDTMDFEDNFLKNFNGEFKISSDDTSIILDNKKIKVYLK
ncbi:META domain-containing protein [Campylobacter insulaenigrae]|uniref:META domain-containing protein n=2 Tax=Campylobacter insulaenigrae TaxID=260714 RepID=A0ABY3G8T4_9BACT|nr:META domain-containing protein [Campylobacter insulaenigrae]AJC87451.1 putative heat shock protein HslJ [Campylobacter insulaenigrae NCTC 12927]MCR6570810.1 META domain-containing protein [Campylobacter insulaenigrae]MCR6572533.1 META domain-containing protein [Campylobacter insulaenigrae]MCR6573502.1 META domain-containing protein [Campylobacter insulaenigrae]MCR6575296.1 META domain-containing protein [Campylobacter insulaenigrae]